MTITYHSIGTIRTPYKDKEGMPIQPSGAKGIKGTIEIDKRYQEGLQDLDGFSHIILLYHFHRSKGYALTVIPFMDDHPRGLFSTRAPRRPNGIGLSIVRLNRVSGNILYVENVDILDGTPILDIKPCIPDFDLVDVKKTGWVEKHAKKVKRLESDNRFG